MLAKLMSEIIAWRSKYTEIAPLLFPSMNIGRACAARPRAEGLLSVEPPPIGMRKVTDDLALGCTPGFGAVEGVVVGTGAGPPGTAAATATGSEQHAARNCRCCEKFVDFQEALRDLLYGGSMLLMHEWNSKALNVRICLNRNELRIDTSRSKTRRNFVYSQNRGQNIILKTVFEMA